MMSAPESRSWKDLILPTTYKANIAKYYVFRTAFMFCLIFTIDVVFFRANGISVAEITVLAVIWNVTAFVTELPSGILSDRWSRKYTLVLSGLFAALGLFIYSISGSFLPFAVATVLVTLRITLSSGTGNAFLYDSLKEFGAQESYEKILGRCRVLEMISVGVAGVIGSYLAADNIRLPFYLSVITAALAGLVALTFREPRIHMLTMEESIFKHIKGAGKFLLRHPLLRFLFLYFIFMDIAISTLDEYDQLYLTDIDFPLAAFGIWIGIRRNLLGVGGFFAERFKKFSSRRIKTFALMFMIISLVTIGWGPDYIGLAAFMPIFLVWGTAEVLISGEIHARAPSNYRATIESLLVFVGVMIDSPIRLGFGAISDTFGVRTGYLYIAALLILYSPYFFARISTLTRLKAPVTS